MWRTAARETPATVRSVSVATQNSRTRSETVRYAAMVPGFGGLRVGIRPANTAAFAKRKTVPQKSQCADKQRSKPSALPAHTMAGFGEKLRFVTATPWRLAEPIPRRPDDGAQSPKKCCTRRCREIECTALRRSHRFWGCVFLI